MFRRSLNRLSGGHGDLFPVTKTDRLAPEWVMSRATPKAPPKGKRYATVYALGQTRKWKHHNSPAVPIQKIVELPKGPKVEEQVRYITASLSHKKKGMNDIAAQNILEKQQSEALMKNRDFLAHKKPMPEPVKTTGDIFECMEFFERWVLDHRCLLNDNLGGVKPVKMPWVK